jgi:hypothetical protein
MMVRLKGLSVRIILSILFLVICACGQIPNPAKVPKFQYTTLWYSIDQEFYADGEKTHRFQF